MLSSRLYRAVFLWAAMALSLACHASSETVGMRSITFVSPERATNISALVWYPAVVGEKQAQTLIGDNAVFHGVPAYQDAPIAGGRFPLVIIAHGGFRSSPYSVNWLAAALARSGYVAAIINPPALPAGQATQAVVDEFWLRPADLSTAITALTEQMPWSHNIAADRIGAVGFFLGGYTTLALAGARVDNAGFIDACKGEQQRFDCAWFEKGGVDLHQFDSEQLGQSYLEPRLTTAVVIDPEWTHIFSPVSLAAVELPVDLFNTGPWASAESPLNASALADTLSTSHYTTIEPAGKYSSFAECKPKGVFILKEEGADASLCDDGPENPARAETHQRIVNEILSVLDRQLKL